jgi:hypothetical protein
MPQLRGNEPILGLNTHIALICLLFYLQASMKLQTHGKLLKLLLCLLDIAFLAS